MDFQQVVDRRRMVRNYTDEPIDSAVVNRILSNALHVPSAGFSQGWAFLVLETGADRERFWAATWHAREEERAGFSYQGIFRAPLIVVPLSHKQAYLDRYAEADKGVVDKRESFWPAPYWDIDTGMASLLMLLTAVDAGLGALFFGVFPESIGRVREAFVIPEEYSPIGAITIGHPAPDTPSPSLRRGRRGVAEVVHRGRW